MPGLTRRSTALRGDGSFWAVPFSAYVIERWTPDGVLKERWLRKTRWFKPHGGRARVDPTMPPQPVVVDAMEDAQGRLWVLLWVADRNWKSAVRARGYLQGRPRYTYDSGDAYGDSVIEVSDPGTRRLLVSWRAPQQFRTSVGTDEVASFSVGESSAWIDIWKPSLRSSTRGNECRGTWRACSRWGRLRRRRAPLLIRHAAHIPRRWIRQRGWWRRSVVNVTAAI